MKRSIRSLAITMIAVAMAASAVIAVHPTGAASPQEAATGMPPVTDQTMPGHDHVSGTMHSQHGPQTGSVVPKMPGQDAFGAIQEIVRMLEADANTDWSKVNLEALRQHLIDMNEVTLKADAISKPIDGGLEIGVSGSGRTLAAIQRMIPAHGAGAQPDERLERPD